MKPRLAASAMPASAMTLTQIVITAVAAVIVFVAVLVLVLELPRLRARRQARPGRVQWPVAGRPVAGKPAGQGQGPVPFGPAVDGEYGAAPGYGHPAGDGPPPLWTGWPYDPRTVWRR